MAYFYSSYWLFSGTIAIFVPFWGYFFCVTVWKNELTLILVVFALLYFLCWVEVYLFGIGTGHFPAAFFIIWECVTGTLFSPYFFSYFF